MIDTSAARASVLDRIKEALLTPQLATDVDPSAKWADLPRDYQRATTLSQASVVELLEDRLRDYEAQVVQSSESHVAETVATLIAARGLPRMLIPTGVPTAWLPAQVNFTVDQGLSALQLNEFDGVLTGATLAIAETGTLVLQNVAGQGRRAATLVPDYHLCILRSADVVATVPEAMARLSATASLPTTFVSGPSATADIEMTRIKGVHGPRLLDVVVLQGS